MSDLKFELIDIDRLKPYANNARKHSPQQIQKLRESIREFGFVTTVLIDQDYNIIAGHGRTEAAKQEGLKQLPCVFVEGLSEEQRRAYVLQDNRLGELSSWDQETLRSELDALNDLAFDMSSFDGMRPEEKALEDRILEESEWQPAADRKVEKAAEKMRGLLEELARREPERVAKARLIVLPGERGGTDDCLVLVDESCADIVAEIKRLAEQGWASPLAALAGGLVDYETNA